MATRQDYERLAAMIAALSAAKVMLEQGRLDVVKVAVDTGLEQAKALLADWEAQMKTGGE
ncbi:MAG: hypothetical protein U1A16_01740 [Patescibacteria group bacterium]|nr:hypothetical protein [Patescibacteria group bacterium]